MTHKILLVDDDLYIRELYEEVLKDAGYEVITAKDGAEGLKKMKTGGFDLILLDVMMPQLDGIQVLRNMKDIPSEKPNGKTILLTNLSHDPIIQEGLQNGASSYLIKADITPDELVSSIKKLLDKQ